MFPDDLDSSSTAALLLLMRGRFSERAWSDVADLEARLMAQAVQSGLVGDRVVITSLITHAIDDLPEPDRSAVRVMTGIDPRFSSFRIKREMILQEMGTLLASPAAGRSNVPLSRRQTEKIERELLAPAVWANLRRHLEALENTMPISGGVKSSMSHATPQVQNGEPAESIGISQVSELFADLSSRARIIEKVTRIVASRGLDDATWATAISAQYFLVLLAQTLDMTEQPDYSRLMNRFLQSFTYQINDTVRLDEKHILVTPEETRKIAEHMLEEDKEDPHYVTAEKTAAENIDHERMQMNYLYGLTVAIAGAPPRNSTILHALQAAAIDQLFYADEGASLDPYGGWVPYRVPWITGRILISLANMHITPRADYGYLQKVIDMALKSLFDRMVEGTHWRSGCGTWLSNWESTGICLEALMSWDSRIQAARYREVIIHILESERDWMRNPPKFASADASDESLAATIIASLLVQCSSEPEFFDLNLDAPRYIEYLETVLTAILSSDHNSPRQFCTIPQVCYYAAVASRSSL